MITTAVKRVFSSQESSWQSIVGSPELPLPGTPAYTESIGRLTNSRFLLHSSGQPATENETKAFLIEAIRNLQNQNAAIYSELRGLRQQVEIIQDKVLKS